MQAQIQIQTQIQTQVNEYPWMVVFANKEADNQGGCGATLVCINLILVVSINDHVCINARPEGEPPPVIGH